MTSNREKLNALLLKLSNLGIRPVLGVELEFYILGDISEQLLEYLSHGIGLRIEKENGNNQYEIATDVFYNPFHLIDHVYSVRNRLITIAKDNHLDISFSPKPYPNDYGSGMHIHLSLVDKKNINIFNKYDTIDENEILLNTIGGMLMLLNKSLNLIINDEEKEFKRLHCSEMAPSTVSWGKNNRTTAIRIPDSHPCNRNRRIEFRVPSASSNLINCIIFLLTSVIYGIENEVLPENCIYGNANDTTYNLILLHKNSDDMRRAFTFWEIFDSLLKK